MDQPWYGDVDEDTAEAFRMLLFQTIIATIAFLQEVANLGNTCTASEFAEYQIGLSRSADDVLSVLWAFGMRLPSRDAQIPLLQRRLIIALKFGRPARGDDTDSIRQILEEICADRVQGLLQCPAGHVLHVIHATTMPCQLEFVEEIVATFLSTHSDRHRADCHWRVSQRKWTGKPPARPPPQMSAFLRNCIEQGQRSQEQAGVAQAAFDVTSISSRDPPIHSDEKADVPQSDVRVVEQGYSWPTHGPPRPPPARQNAPCSASRVSAQQQQHRSQPQPQRSQRSHQPQQGRSGHGGNIAANSGSGYVASGGSGRQPPHRPNVSAAPPAAVAVPPVNPTAHLAAAAPVAPIAQQAPAAYVPPVHAQPPMVQAPQLGTGIQVMTDSLRAMEVMGTISPHQVNAPLTLPPGNIYSQRLAKLATTEATPILASAVNAGHISSQIAIVSMGRHRHSTGVSRGGGDIQHLINLGNTQAALGLEGLYLFCVFLFVYPFKSKNLFSESTTSH